MEGEFGHLSLQKEWVHDEAWVFQSSKLDHEGASGKLTKIYFVVNPHYLKITVCLCSIPTVGALPAVAFRDSIDNKAEDPEENPGLRTAFWGSQCLMGLAARK